MNYVVNDLDGNGLNLNRAATYRWRVNVFTLNDWNNTVDSWFSKVFDGLKPWQDYC